jgi:hypothetical protein
VQSAEAGGAETTTTANTAVEVTPRIRERKVACTAPPFSTKRIRHLGQYGCDHFAWWIIARVDFHASILFPTIAAFGAIAVALG